MRFSVLRGRGFLRWCGEIYAPPPVLIFDVGQPVVEISGKLRQCTFLKPFSVAT